MQQLSLQPVPSQQLQAVLGGQNCQISIYQKNQGIFVDVSADGVHISTGVIARDAVPLVAIGYTGFQGNFILIDTQGASDPDYTGLGIRYQLIYLTAAEYELISK